MTPASAHKIDRAFDPDIFLATIGEGRKIVTVRKKRAIYTQGDEADAVFYVQKGSRKLELFQPRSPQNSPHCYNGGTANR